MAYRSFRSEEFSAGGVRECILFLSKENDKCNMKKEDNTGSGIEMFDKPE